MSDRIVLGLAFNYDAPAIPIIGLSKLRHYDASHPEVVAVVSRMVGRSGSPELVEECASADKAAGPNPRNGGRPAIVSVSAAICLYLLLAVENRPLHAKHIVDLVSRLQPESLDLLGLPANVSKTNVYRAIRRVLDVIDPYPAPRKWSMSGEDQEWLRSGLAPDRKPKPTDARRRGEPIVPLDERLTPQMRERITRDRSPERQAELERRLSEFANRLVRAAWLLLPRDVRRKFKGDYAIDATVVPAFAKWPGKRTKTTSEPDAGWHVKSGDHLGTGNESPAELEYGWHLSLTVSRLYRKGDPKNYPLIPTGIGFDRPGLRPHAIGLDMLTQMTDAGFPTGSIVGDMLYWPGGAPENWQTPVRRLGFKNINDYPDHELGIKGGEFGWVECEGERYNQCFPEVLGNATIDHRAGTIDYDTWQTRLEARKAFRVERHGAAGPGKHQCNCSGYGKNARVVCDGKKQVREISPNWIPVTVRELPNHRGPICAQNMVTVSDFWGAKRRQDVAFGTPEWNDTYGERNTVEGYFRYLKDSRFDLANPDRRRLKGQTAQAVLVTFLVVASSIRKIVKFMREHYRQPDKPLRPKWTPAPTRVRKQSRPAGRATANAPPSDTHLAS